MERKLVAFTHFSLFFICLFLTSAAVHAQSEDEKALALYERIFNQWLDRNPVWQSQLGIKDQADKWDDLSEAFAIQGQKQAQQQLQDLKKIHIKKLTTNVALSHRLLVQQLNTEIEHYQWRHHNYPVNQMFGWHSRVPSTLINIHLIENEKDAQDYISRIKNTKLLMSQLIESLQIREHKGIIPPKFVFPKIIEDSQNLLKGKPFNGQEDSPILADFRKKVIALKLAKTTEKRLLSQAKEALNQQLKPGYNALISYLHTLEKKADDRAGAWKFPNGAAFYDAALKRTTTTDLTADEIHQLGLDEVARIHKEMRTIVKKVKFSGDLNQFFQHLKTDDQFYYSNDEKGRKAYLEKTWQTVNTMEEFLPKLFITLPKAKLKVKAVEPFREKSAGKAFYQSPPPDGSRPGIYYANLYNMREMPKYQLEALVHHEALPGHHLQLSIATELGEIPKFRKYGHYTAYVEGWGLYAELLPKEVGLYQDPYSDFGRLDMELWRACRLVVDTGLHAKKWTREQAIQYLLDNTPTVESGARRAIERYIVMPSQATAYKIGMLKLLEIRSKLKEKQKDNFDIRQYHEQVLKMGPVPLNILEEQILGASI